VGGGGGEGEGEGGGGGEGEREVEKEREGGGRGERKREGGGNTGTFFTLLCTLETFDLMNLSHSQHWLQLHPHKCPCKGHKVQLRADMLICGQILGEHSLR